jgi:hypothetical protein
MNEKIDGTQAALLHRFSAWLAGGFATMALGWVNNWRTSRRISSGMICSGGMLPMGYTHC